MKSLSSQKWLMCHSSCKLEPWSPSSWLVGESWRMWWGKNGEETALKSNILMKSNVILYTSFLRNIELGYFFFIFLQRWLIRRMMFQWDTLWRIHYEFFVPTYWSEPFLFLLLFYFSAVLGIFFAILAHFNKLFRFHGYWRSSEIMNS